MGFTAAKAETTLVVGCASCDDAQVFILEDILECQDLLVCSWLSILGDGFEDGFVWVTIFQFRSGLNPIISN